MDLTRRERDEILAKKMPIIEKLNEEIGRRQKEITQDELWAQKSKAIFVDAPLKIRTDPKNRLLLSSRDQGGDDRWPRGMWEGEGGRKPLGEVNHFHRVKPDNTNKYYTVDQSDKREYIKAPPKQRGALNKPPSPPKFNFLADPYRDTPCKQPQLDHNVRMGGSRRYPGNFGGKNLLKSLKTPQQKANSELPHNISNSHTSSWNGTNIQRSGGENGSENSFKSDSSNSSLAPTRSAHTNDRSGGQAYIEKHLSHYNPQNRRQEFSAYIPSPQRHRNFSPDPGTDRAAFKPVLRSKTETNIRFNNHRRKPHMPDKGKNTFDVNSEYSNCFQSPNQKPLDRSNQETKNFKSFKKSQSKAGNRKSIPKNTLGKPSRDFSDNSKCDAKVTKSIPSEENQFCETLNGNLTDNETALRSNKNTNQTPLLKALPPHKNCQNILYDTCNYDVKSSPAYRILDANPLNNLSSTAITREEYEAVLEEIMSEDPFLASQDVNFEPSDVGLNFENLNSSNFSAQFVSPILKELSNLSLIRDAPDDGAENPNSNPESDPPLTWDSSVDIGNV